MKSANTAERLAESGENSAERREVCQDQERGCRCADGPVSSRGIAVCRNGAFPGKHCQFLPQDTAHELSLSADRHSLLARPSGLGLDDTVNFSAGFSTSQGLTSLTWAVEHGTERCCSAADLTSLYFHIWRQMDLLQTCTFTDTSLKVSPFSFRKAFSKATLQSPYQYPNVERSASKVTWPWPCPMSRSLLRHVNFSKCSCLCQLTFQALQMTFQDGNTLKWSECQQEMALWLCMNFKGVPIQIAHKSCSSNPTEPE